MIKLSGIDDTLPFPIHVDPVDTKPKRVDSGLFPKHDLTDKIQDDARKRESAAEAPCPKCQGHVHYRGLIEVECLTPKCENYRFKRGE